ncbi:DHHC zinc finger membrane protein [Metarhizium guizhouense ARSEF 977]|uniref:Palmitoyltransferase n=1 Tax=Metarhizium guizhouense (strain ARSEF 977) TaxID=1276136 RepID=A0A0B4GYA5_METGA|nr:DHHC zinc finger membrane protein [Metarhizium guizhouense ARSEF 977]
MSHTRWLFSIIPAFIVGVFGLGAYAVVGRLCVEYILRRQGKTGLAAGLLVLFFPLYILALVCYAQLYITVQRDPGLVPLTNGRDDKSPEPGEKRRGFRSRRKTDPEDPPWVPPDLNPDSPGLEAFYSKDVFACEADGRPKWCSECRQWKPDRAHHSREMGRCVRKMDHMCPWVGGMVSETFDGWIIAILVISSFFGLFALGMTLTGGRFLLTNITNIDMLRRRQTFNLAVRIPLGTPASTKYQTITYPILPKVAGATGSGQLDDDAAASTSARDQDAFRTFAILKTEPYENPWDLGFWENWKSVMGNEPWEWFLPIRHSPCCNHDSMHSDYRLGPVLDDLKKRYELPEFPDRSVSPDRV